MRLGSYKKDIRREFKRSLSRFLSITMIVCLGVGVFAGMKATAPTMIASANDLFTKYNTMDIKLLSLSGFGDGDVTAVSNVEGVKDVMASYSTDVLTKLPNEKSYKATKFMALMDNHTINQVKLIKGRLPEKSGECAICAENIVGTKYKIGDTISVYETAGTTAVNTVLKSLEYKVVGIVNSSLYFSYTLGSTSVGDGNIYAYAFIPQSDFLYQRYTELYVSAEYDRDKVSAYSDEYQAVIDDLVKKLDPLGAERQKIFKSETEKEISGYEDELASKREEAYNKLAEAKEELNSSKQQLNDALAQIKAGWKEYESEQKSYEQLIADSEKQIADAEKEIANFKKQIADAEKEYAEGVKLLAESRKPLDDGWKEYYDGLAKYEEGLAGYNKLIDAKNQIDKGQKDYDAGVKQYEDGLKQLNDAKAQYEADLAQWNAEDAAYRKSSFPNPLTRIALDIRKATLDRTYQEIVSGEQQVIDGKKQLDDAKIQLDDAKAQYAQALKDNGISDPSEIAAQLKDAKAELEAARQKLEDGENEYDAGELELKDAKLQIEDGKKQITDGEKQLADSKKQLEAGKKEGSTKFKDSKKQLEDGEKEYQSGLDKYNDGLAEYETAKTDAEKQLEDGAAQIQSARNMFMELSADKWYVFSRDDAISNYKGYGQDSSRIDAISALFPVFFLLVAALVCVTTMSRMVDEQRSQMGTYKALGYSAKQILFKYLVYSLIASVVGGILGQIFCIIVFPRAIMSAYNMMYRIPQIITVIPWSMVGISLAAGIACTAVVTLICCRKEVSAITASLMRPKAPKAGKTILLEKIPIIWNRFNFSTKIAVRNLFRYKIRFLMTVIGITGCTALILSGFGLQNAISPIADLQYQKLSSYDILASLYEPYDAEKTTEMTKEYIKDGTFGKLSFQKQMEITAKSDNSKESVSGSTYLVIPQNVKSFEELNHLYDDNTGKKLDLNKKGAIVTNKMAETLDISIGDDIIFIYNDSDYRVKVSGIAENYVYNYVYMSPDTYESVMKEKLDYNCFIATYGEKELSVEQILAKDSNILTAIPVITASTVMADTISSMNLVVAILIISASCLAIVVLYNLTNINISERIREIATTKVLGFNEKEADMYIFRENIIMTVIGLIFGNIGGYALAQKMIDMVEVDIVVFSRTINLSSYIYATLITIIITVVVMFIMRGKIKRIDMVEALKSIE